MSYHELLRRVRDHHREAGEAVDFWLMKHGSIVAHYRVRPIDSDVWTDLLPTGASADTYRRTIQRLVPILFPEEDVSIAAVEREDREVTLSVLRE